MRLALKKEGLIYGKMSGLTLAVAFISPKSVPAEYTRFFVDNAISRYETQGLDATLAHYNREESIDGQRYVFIIDENDRLITHPNPCRLGLDLKSWVGTDANGYNFGSDMLSATEDGKWASYVTGYNSADNVGGDRFTFIADESGTVIDHYNKEMVGTDLTDLLGADMFVVTAEGNRVNTEDARLGGRLIRDDVRLRLA